MLLFARRSRSAFLIFIAVACMVLPVQPVYAADNELRLDDLIEEGLRNSPEILAAQAKAQAAGYRIPQAKALPDPMFMFGYQNEGFKRFTLGEEQEVSPQEGGECQRRRE